MRILTLLNGLQKVPTVKSPCLSHIFIESRGITKCQLPFPRRKGRVRFKKAQLPRLIFDDAGRQGGKDQPFVLAMGNRFRHGLHHVAAAYGIVIPAIGCRFIRIPDGKIQQLGKRDGPAVEISLHPFTAHALEILQLRFGFNPFYKSLHPQLLDHGNEGPDDEVSPVDMGTAHKKAQVKLDQIHIQILEETQRGKTASKIIHPDFIAMIPQILDLVLED